MDLVPPPPELGDHILREEAGVAPGHINIHVLHPGQTVQNRFKLVQKLDLIQQDIVHPVVLDAFLEIGVEHIGVSECTIFKGIKGDLDDARCLRPFGQQVFFE